MLLPLWEKAVHFIEANESRIRLENQTIQGEDFIVWRWLPVSPVGNYIILFTFILFVNTILVLLCRNKVYHVCLIMVLYLVILTEVLLIGCKIIFYEEVLE